MIAAQLNMKAKTTNLLEETFAGCAKQYGCGSKTLNTNVPLSLIVTFGGILPKGNVVPILAIKDARSQVQI